MYLDLPCVDSIVHMSTEDASKCLNFNQLKLAPHATTQRQVSFNQ